MLNLNDCLAYMTTEHSKKILEVFQRQLDEYNISKSQWLVLYYVYENTNITQIELAKLMQIKGPTLTNLIQTLEKEGYLRRVSSEYDKRAKQLLLLEKGKRKLRESIEFVKHFHDEITEGISDEDLQKAKDVLAKLRMKAELMK